MNTKQVAIYSIIIFLVIFFVIRGVWKRSGFKFKEYTTPSQAYPKGTKFVEGSTFDNAEYQTYYPSVDMQSDYYQCIANECQGDTFNYSCLQRCHLKSYRRDMTSPDHADWVCYRKRFDEDEYYKCLANVYADYRYP